MEQAIIIVHVVMAVAIIGLIMIQQGKGADMGASFGGGGANTVFGAAGGGNLLTRMTSIAVTGFFITSLGLAIVAKDKAQVLGDVDLDVPVVEESVELVIPEEPAAPALDDAIPE